MIIKNKIILLGILSLTALISINSCKESENKNDKISKMDINNIEETFKTTMQTHLDAVSNRDMETLKSTMSPDGKMQLILPGSKIMNTVDKFIEYHIEWFKDTTWTFETKILNTEIGEKLGIAIVEVMYKEPNRNGKPYFNKMIVSYALKRDKTNWYIIKDHACSIERTED